MSSSLDPDAVLERHPAREGGFGPSDTSDSASDVLGTDIEALDSDSNGTGERQSVESIPPSQTERDIEPDKIVTSPAPAVPVSSDDEESEDDLDGDEDIDADGEDGDDQTE